LGKAGIHSTAAPGETVSESIFANNVVEDAGGEGLGTFGLAYRTLIIGNTSRYVSYGRSQILLEGDSSTGNQPTQCVIANNTVVARYTGINIKSSNDVIIANNNITVVAGGSKIDGIECIGNSKGVQILNNTISGVEGDGIKLQGRLTDGRIIGNTIKNVSNATSNIYNGINFVMGGPYTNIRISDNLIDDDRGEGNQKMKHGINFQMNGNTITNIWCQNNQIYNQIGNAINYDWTTNGRFLGDAHFFNNTADNPYGKVTNPFNNTHSQVGIPAGSTNSYTFAAAPNASTEYTVVMSQIQVWSTGGSGVSITVKDMSEGNILMAGATTLTGLVMHRGWTINFGSFSSAPTVTIVRT
jgi:hypothetical protein